MQYYFRNKETKKVFSHDITSLKQLAELQRKYDMATPQERIAFIKGITAEQEQKDKEERQYASKNNLLNVYYMAPVKNDDGYGTTAKNIKALAVQEGVYFDLKADSQKIGLCYHLPNTLQLVKTPVKIAYTMFETTKYPAFWEPYLKSADLVIVPTQFCADTMHATFGIMPEVVPLGYNPEAFYYLERKQKEVFTFLHYDAFKWRKGWDILFNAFNAEFGEKDGEQDVRLILKTTLSFTPPLHEYPKIKVIKGRIPQGEMMDIMRQADCFAFPTRGEGFGLTPLEAMATGMRAIVPNHSGMSHYWHKDYCYNLETNEVRAKYDNIELRGLELGNYWEPTVESTRRALRQAYNDWKAGHYYDNQKDIAEYCKQFTIQATTKKLCAILKRFV